MNFDLPYKIEYTHPNDNDCCKMCHVQFIQNNIRIAVMVQSNNDDRKDPLWHHVKCFFEQHSVNSIEEIGNFENIKYNDQTDILTHIDPRQKLKLEYIIESVEEPFDPHSPKHFGIEYSTSKEELCQVCNKAIAHNDIQIKKVIYDGEIAAKFGREILWHHFHCFILMRKYHGFRAGGEMLPGFDRLQEHHKQTVKDTLCSLDTTDHNQSHVDESEENESRSEITLERTIANQSAELLRVRQSLQRVCPEEDLQLFLIFNESGVVEGLDNLLDRCADFLAFGGLYKCQKCNIGDMIFTKYGYTCNGMRNEWVKCGHFEEKPLRFKCAIPHKMKRNPFFSTCDLIVEDRAVRKCDEDQIRENSFNTTSHCPSKTKITNLKIKDGTVVDPKSGLDDVAHVFRRNGVLYTTALALTDIQNNKNSYHKIQLLESDIKASQKYWLFSSWGRIGTTIGDSKVELFLSRDAACDQFEKLFKKQTGNNWNDHSFKKFPRKFYPIDINYTDDIIVNSSAASKLSPEVEELMKILFNIQTMKETMESDFQLDLERMPLGKLSRKQLEQACIALVELESAIVADRTKIELIGLSEKFFTLIPHNFGLEKVPILDTLAKINEKRSIVDSLLDIESAYSMMTACVQERNINSFDSYYRKLEADVKLVNRNSAEHKMIETYISRSLKFEAVDIFEVNRHSETTRYATHRNLPNRRLLFHGSRITNFASILSKGLKICQPVHGSTFGRGIYFADMCIKSSNYCGRIGNTIMMVLADVASYRVYQGGAFPDPNENYVREDGLIIPLGTIRGSGGHTEYVVENENHIKIQYLIKLTLN